MTDERNEITGEETDLTIDRSILSAAGLLRCETCGEPAGCDDRFCGSCGSHLGPHDDVDSATPPQLLWFDGIWRAIDTLPGGQDTPPVQISEDWHTFSRRETDQGPFSDRASQSTMDDATRFALTREARRRFRRSALWLLGTGTPLLMSYGPGSGIMPARWFLVAIAAYGCFRFASGVRVLVRPELLFDDGTRHR